MKSIQQAIYTSLKLLPNGLTEATAEAMAVLDRKKGVLDIEGILDLNPNSLRLSSPDAETYVESVLHPFPFETLLPKGTAIIAVTKNEAIEGEVLHDYNFEGHEKLVLKRKDDNQLAIFSNREDFPQINLVGDFPTEPILRVLYARENPSEVASAKPSSLAITHHLRGISCGGVTYELSEKEHKLKIIPTLEISNERSEGFAAVELTIVAPAVPKAEGTIVRPEISPLVSELQRSEAIIHHRGELAYRGAGTRRVPTLGGAPAEEMDTLGYVEEVLFVGEVEETLEGRAITLEGKYNLFPNEKRKLVLDGIETEQYQHAKVLLVNPSKYNAGLHLTTILETMRFSPKEELKAGSFFVDGVQMAFPAMKAGQEYELGLRTCQNLYATVSKEEGQTLDARGNKKVTSLYTVTLANDTSQPQEVEVNLPEAVLRKMGEYSLNDEAKYELKEVVGEKCYAAKYSLEPKSKTVFTFEVK